MAEAPPPPYNAIVQGLVTQVGGKQVSMDQLNQYAASLSTDQKATLVNSEKPDPANLDPVAVKAYQDKVKADMLSPDAVEKFKQAARDAVTACKGIDAMFMSLYALLAQIDNENGLTGSDQFLPTFGLLQNSWRKILLDSRTLAADVAVNAQSFDQTVMPTVADATLDQATKLAIIEAERQGTEGYEGRSQDINTRLGTLVDDFEKFVGTFGTWGAEKLGTLNAQIEQAKKELNTLLDQAQTLRNTMIGFGVAVGVGVLIAAGGCFAGPFAPVFWVAGGIIALGFGFGLLAVGIEYSNTLDDISAKKKEIQGLQQQVTDIENARTGLQNAGKDDVTYIQAHIGGMTGIWTNLNTDLDQIVDWIQKGENMENLANVPDYIKMNLVGTQIANASAIYSKVGEYLTEYSNGMIASGIPNPT